MRQLEEWEEIERSISKKYRKDIWNPFVEAVKQYQLIKPGDCVAVCISGGKDSMLLAVLLRMLNRYSDFPFTLKYIGMDPGYNRKNREQIELNAKILDLPIEIFKTDIFATCDNVGGNPCYLCARMRRGNLYNFAKSLGCNKIALGHHFDDVIETTLIGMFYGSQLQGMMPKLHSTNFEGMELIRPLYKVHESSIVSWKNYNNLTFISCACSVAEKNEQLENGSKRQEIKKLIKELKKTNPEVDTSIFNSIHGVCLDTFPHYKSKGREHDFLDEY